MKDYVPLCHTRIWCRKNEAWLSFKTVTQDRFLVNPDGYYIELPDGSLAKISPRTTFPLIDRLPALVLSQLTPRKQFGEEAYFISVPLRTQQSQEPVMVPLAELEQDPLVELDAGLPLEELERYLLLRVLEHGAMPASQIGHILSERAESEKTIGEILIGGNFYHWEALLAQSLDVRPPSRLDPPHLRTIIERREWELIGEILVSLDKINRTELEHALKVKREGNQALGQILNIMGVCSAEDIQHCLQIQETLQTADSDGVVLIGKLLVGRGVISETDLEDALWKQQVARQPLGRILVSMSACSQGEIDRYESAHISSFQQAIDEAALGNYLVKTDTILQSQLEEALRIQQRGRQVLGEMLVALRLCAQQDIEAAVALQKDVKEACRSGLQQLGQLLIHKGMVPKLTVDEALKLQSVGRQLFGAILVAMGACSREDVDFALEIQRTWRSQCQETGDRLGEVLLKHGIITEAQLEEPLKQHVAEEKPLGRILVEKGICRPEQIIGALSERDNARQKTFLQYVRSHLVDSSAQSTSQSNQSGQPDESSSHFPAIQPAQARTAGEKLAEVFSSLMRKPSKK